MNNLLSVRQVAFILKVHPLSVRRYISQGKLKAVKVAGNVRIPESNLANMQTDVKETVPKEKRIFKSLKPHVIFSPGDPIFRLEGRGASLTEGKYE